MLNDWPIARHRLREGEDAVGVLLAVVAEQALRVHRAATGRCACRQAGDELEMTVRKADVAAPLVEWRVNPERKGVGIVHTVDRPAVADDRPRRRRRLLPVLGAQLAMNRHARVRDVGAGLQVGRECRIPIRRRCGFVLVEAVVLAGQNLTLGFGSDGLTHISVV